jgi:hypothetical protein
METVQRDDTATPYDNRTAPASRKISLPEPLSQFIAKLAFELVVVFAGVSLAFVAENRRQEAQKLSQARDIYSALAAELTDHTTVGQQVLNRYLARQKEWDDAFAGGQRPIPWFIPWGNVGPPRAAWEATVSGGGIGLIDRPLFYELAKYYGLVEMYMVPVDAQDAFVDAEIVPHLQEGPDAFYMLGKHELRPTYRAYVDRRRVVLAGAEAGLVSGRSLLAELRRRAGDTIAAVHP